MRRQQTRLHGSEGYIVICPDYLIQGLEKQFRQIQQERMEGLPLLNPALRLEAVGFREWNGLCLGVLVTPWFMNLMLLPPEGDSWKATKVGDKQLYQMPSGPYEFIVCEEEGIGRYQMCSLFSPVFEFADQATAVATAEAVMDALMRVEHRDTISTRESEIERFWKGEPDEQAVDGQDGSVQEERPTISQRLEQPLSRRDLLRGGAKQNLDADA
ncbi:MAG: [NiFe]-hydrogenase assembly chaperone HybE [Candidatus Thiodiazotropha endolucinida]